MKPLTESEALKRYPPRDYQTEVISSRKTLSVAIREAKAAGGYVVRDAFGDYLALLSTPYPKESFQ